MEYRNPKPTVDVVIATPRASCSFGGPIPPMAGHFPGASLTSGNRPRPLPSGRCVRRPASRSTLDALLGVYSDPKRDPRHHTLAALTAASEEFPVGGTMRSRPGASRWIPCRIPLPSTTPGSCGTTCTFPRPANVSTPCEKSGADPREHLAQDRRVYGAALVPRPDLSGFKWNRCRLPAFEHGTEDRYGRL